MARINVDSDALQDPRITKRLPRYSGLAAFDALGRLLHVWALGYARKSCELSEADIEEAADHVGFAAAMVQAGLAEVRDGGKFHVSGLADRIGYLVKHQAASAAGGAARAEKARRDGERVAGRFVSKTTNDQPPAGENQPSPGETPAGGFQTAGEHQPSTSRSSLLYSGSSLLYSGSGSTCPPTADSSGKPGRGSEPEVSDPERENQNPIPESKPRAPARARTPATPAPSGYQDVVAAFDTAYRAQNGGARPTWGEKPGAQLKRLIAAHGPHEVIQRIGRLFGGQVASWCQPPYDVGTLVSLFDRLAVVTAPPSPVRASAPPPPTAGRRIDPNQVGGMRVYRPPPRPPATDGGDDGRVISFVAAGTVAP